MYVSTASVRPISAEHDAVVNPRDLAWSIDCCSKGGMDVSSLAVFGPLPAIQVALFEILSCITDPEVRQNTIDYLQCRHDEMTERQGA